MANDDTFFLPSTMRSPHSSEKKSDGAAALAIPLQMTLPWRHNGRRCISTGLAPAYYAVYLYEIEVDDSTDSQPELRLHMQAIGEWDLPHPGEQCLMSVLRAGEDWETVAKLERKGDGRSSRFVRPTWIPHYQSPGYFSGVLSVTWPNVTVSVGTVRRLQFAFGRTSPWQSSAGYPIVTLLEFTVGRTGESISCPRTKAPVDPRKPWAPVLPPEVEERFRLRELEREANKEQNVEKETSQPRDPNTSIIME